MDDPNLNDKNKDFQEWWEGVEKEETAKMEKMEAEERMPHQEMLENFRTEASAAKDWVAADWEQFKGRVQQWTNKAEVKADDAI